MKKLEMSEMEIFKGGGDIWSNRRDCEEFSTALGGSAVIIGVSSWWTGAGGGLSAVMGAVAWAWSSRCDGLK